MEALNKYDSNIRAEVLQAKQALGIVGNSPRLLSAIERAVEVAPVDLSVLVVGESGTGKEFFPKIIHRYSPRKHARYIAVNCGAIPEGTIDSELFGHEKGSFTSAISDRRGYFEEADGGTIFLDEVAELPLTTQARLLRVLETGEYMRVGSSAVRKTNIRIVAATNVDLTRAIAEGKFREDLYYRLSGVQIPVAPLRDRGNDILLLARKFASDAADRYSRGAISFTRDAEMLMLDYRWPGNVRQLKNVIEQLAIFESGQVIGKDVIEPYLPPNASTYSPSVIGGHSDGAASGLYEREREMLFNMIFSLREEIDALRARLDGREVVAQHRIAEHVGVDKAREDLGSIKSLVKFKPPVVTSENDVEPISHSEVEEIVVEPKTLEQSEREMIREALDRNDGRRKAAAEQLNISERTLYRKIKEYGLE